MMNTQAELEHIEYLLSDESYEAWVDKITYDELVEVINKHDPHHEHDMKWLYLKEHGLPLDSKIEGLS